MTRRALGKAADRFREGNFKRPQREPRTDLENLGIWLKPQRAQAAQQVSSDSRASIKTLEACEKSERLISTS